MVEKKSFVMYKTWKSAVDKLSNEQKGMLLAAIFDYQAGEETEIDDVAVAVFFEIIKQQFTEDEEKYVETVRKRSEAGKQGNKARWGKDREEKQDRKDDSVANGISATEYIASDRNATSDIANVADNVNVNDNVNDNVKNTHSSISGTEGPQKESECSKIIDLYNSICKSLTPAITISASRTELIKNALKTRSPDELKEIFIRAQSSPFLTGGGDKGWKASLDWILKEENIAKILDGNFDKPKRTAGQKQRGQFNNYTHEECDWNEMGRILMMKQRAESQKAESKNEAGESNGS